MYRKEANKRRDHRRDQGKIRQAVGDLSGNKRLKREDERGERKAKSKAR
jgi:uncharacterized protein YjbJ (UPF0337 family)